VASNREGEEFEGRERGLYHAQNFVQDWGGDQVLQERRKQSGSRVLKLRKFQELSFSFIERGGGGREVQGNFSPLIVMGISRQGEKGPGV